MEAVLATRSLRFLDLICYPDIDILPGRATFITGNSGSGKSTLLKLFNGVVSAQSGEVYYNGQNIEKLDSIELRRQVLLVSQSVFLFDETIAENFARFYRFRDLMPPDEATMQDFLRLCSAEFPTDTLCTSMSGGERQRVYTAIFLSFLPKVLMLDEPTSALDTANAVQLLQNLKKFCQSSEITLVVVSHDQALVQRFADDTVTLEGGQCE